MGEMEDKLNTILGNPQLMQNILSMAQSLNQEQPSAPSQPAPLPDFDPALLQKLGNLAGQSNVDPQQKALLNALSPYITRSRIIKLEKAMRAAKMAKFASAFLNSGGIKLLTGR